MRDRNIFLSLSAYILILYAGGMFMDYYHENTYDLYKDIQKRTKGELYLGVVGPVRTGKSTFIKRFMELLVLPEIISEEEKVRTRDELPQSASGKTITTTEPKFIPKEAAKINLSEDIQVKVRLIDCVGYMIDGATGHLENDKERMVKTPWEEKEMPFTRAAEIGTRKVIEDHSTIGIVMTTDGSIGELKRENYLQAEERTIQELKKLQKPFLVILNTVKPYSEEAQALVESLKNKYNVTVMAMNCMQMKKEDIFQCLKNVLYEFPVSAVGFHVPKWVESLSILHPLKSDIITQIRNYMEQIDKMKDVLTKVPELKSDYVKKCTSVEVSMAEGRVNYQLDIDEKYYYEMLSEMTGETIENQYQLLSLLKEYKEQKLEYGKVIEAMENVRNYGYGVVLPKREEISIEEPVVVKHGNKFGVKIKAESPSIHMIKANITTEIAPIVGSEQQALDLISYIKEEKEQGNGIWDTNIFGKTVEQLIQEGISSKIAAVGKESQQNLQESMQKILNESNGGMIFIII